MSSVARTPPCISAHCARRAGQPRRVHGFEHDVVHVWRRVEHPLLGHGFGSNTDSEGLLRALASEAAAALTRAEAAKAAMPTQDVLLTLHEDAWREHALARDQARQEQVHFASFKSQL